MSIRGFKPPSFKNPLVSDTKSQQYLATSTTKRRRLSTERLPLSSIDNVSATERARRNAKEDDVCTDKLFYSIIWRKVTTKKNKTWDDDGVAIHNGALVTCFNSKGHKLGSTSRDSIAVEDLICINGKDIQIEAKISQNDFHKVVAKDNDNPSKPDSTISKVGIQTKSLGTPKLSLQDQMRQQILAKSKSNTPLIPSPQNTAFKQPLKHSDVLEQVPSETPIPRHNPAGPNALVFRRPKKAPKGKQIVDVVLDPVLAKHLRDHQRAGVEFLYECVMGLRDFGGEGCILADDMGLGKTLQTIALIWTLVKQNPIYREDPVLKKVLVVCPVTLVQNWKKEFRKWLGRDKIGVMCVDDPGSRLSMFDGRNFKVMVVGYERLRTIAEDLTRGAGIDLVICDEGHRLKTLQNRSAKAIDSLNTSRRIILSGTPIQNDLSEFFAMTNFVNDGILGSKKAFIKDFEVPILKSRQPGASPKDIDNGAAASEELSHTTSPFILRRTADILSAYLPPKTEYVLFCSPTPEQASVYRAVLGTSMFNRAVSGSSQNEALQMITILKKLCNSPMLMRPSSGSDESTPSNSLSTLNDLLPKSVARFFHNSYSSKIRLLDELLNQIRTTTSDKVVLVSNYTATLNLMENLLISSGLSFRRLDGSVPQSKRQALVDEFNRTTNTACFAFLLSAKAGGMGINLIGANRLVLFDVDWNPAIDDQAMARIHREGQKKGCHIYRFLIKGGLEERIWQRQVVKRDLAQSIMTVAPDGSGAGTQGPITHGGKSKAAFSAEELRDLFRLDESEGLRTHDLIECECGGRASANDDPSSTRMSTRMNTPSLSVCSTSENNRDDETDEKIHESTSFSDDDDTPLRTFKFTSAATLTDANIVNQEHEISIGSSPVKGRSKKRKREQKENEDGHKQLMEYSHIDMRNFARDSRDEPEMVDKLSTTIEDSCLLHVLRKGKDVIPGSIAYIFLKRRGAKVQNLEEAQAVMDANESKGGR